MKKLLFIVYQAPCGSIWVNELFRTAFGMYGEDLEPNVLLMEEASITIGKGTEPQKLGLFPIKIVQGYISKYETKVYAVKEDLESFNIKDIDENYKAEIIPMKQVKELVHSSDFVIFM
ncbi:intracellular sulfur oxidation protein [Caldisericum sp. AR60]|uniref:intracellular sulfur oxidation protein n=1 Tax=Caldisericum sp. AR60 TaxID=3397852 RepID=UPI0039FCA36E